MELYERLWYEMRRLLLLKVSNPDKYQEEIDGLAQCRMLYRTMEDMEQDALLKQFSVPEGE